MYRLFTAIRPAADIRRQLIEIMGGVMAARWQDDDQLHLTLRFIGEVDGRTAEDVALALSTIRFPPVEIRICGVGTFDRKGKIDTLWAGVADTGDLATLHRKIDRALVGIGLAPEGRAYRPHITLARFGGHGGDVGGFIAQHGGLSLPPFAANAFDLFESRMHSSGADYAIVERFTLG